MDHRTRVVAAINRIPVDRTPCAELVITDKIIQAMCGQEVVTFDHRLEFVQTMGLDAVCLHPHFALSPKQVPCSQAAEFKDLERWVNTELFTFAVLDGPIGWGGKLFSFEDLMIKLVRGHSDVLELIAVVEQMNQSLMQQLASDGVNGILLADDIAYNQGVIVRPNILRQRLFPSFARQIEHAKQLGLPVIFHSDGNLMSVLDDIVEAGFDGLQCIDPLAGMDIGVIKEQYGKKMCLWGNLDPAELIEVRKIDELEHIVNRIVQTGGRDGGLIFGTSSGLFEDMCLDSIKTVYKIAQSIVIEQEI